MANISFNKSKITIDGMSAYWHNGAAIEAYFKNPKVDTVQKLAMYLLHMYLLPQNKDKNAAERIYAQNPHLVAKFELSKKSGVSTIQKAFRYLEKMGLVEDRIFTCKGESYSLKETGVRGLTKRQTLINLAAYKRYLLALPGDDFYLQLDKRSRDRRFISRRPLTLIEFLNKEITKEQVNQVNQKKQRHQFEAYLKAQMDQYGDFTIDTSYDVALEQLNDPKYIRLLDLLDDLVKPGINPALEKLLAASSN